MSPVTRAFGKFDPDEGHARDVPFRQIAEVEQRQREREAAEVRKAKEADQVAAVEDRRSPMDIPRDPRRAALPYSRVTLFNSKVGGHYE
jgi:hypothetical protein